MGGNLPLSGLQPLVGEVVEAEAGAEVCRRHLGVPHPPLHVVKVQEAPRLGLRALEMEEAR